MAEWISTMSTYESFIDNPTGEEVPKFGDWRPIEMAPMGEFVLVCGSKRMDFPSVARCTKYESGVEWTIETCSSVETIYPPKYWMPLPAMPKGRGR